MTDHETKAMRALVYIAKEIAFAMAVRPHKTAVEIAGAADDREGEMFRLLAAIEAAGALVYPAWDHRHADELNGDAAP
jgi:hypothetical protein